MFYIVSRDDGWHRGSYGIEYRLFETHTGSVRYLTEEVIINMWKKYNIKIENADITENEVKFKKMFNSIDYTKGNEGIAKYTMIAHIRGSSGDKYRLASLKGDTMEVPKEYLEALINKNHISNCRIVNNKIESLYNYVIEVDREFEEQIAEKYRSYAAKSKILGYDSTFRYEIDGHEVKLAFYNGESTFVRVPSFITTIKARAFYRRGTESIILNDELEYLGAYAFSGCDLEELTIKKNVKLIGHSIGIGNIKLDTDSVHILSEDAIQL